MADPPRRANAGLPLVEIMVEWTAGDPQRYEWDETVDAVHAVDDGRIPPEHYGCVPGALNPADGELLDVLLLRDPPRRPGERVTARLVGVLRRADGDHKLLAVDPRHHDLTDVAEVDAGRLRAVWGWFRRPEVLLAWGSPILAHAILEESRAAWRQQRYQAGSGERASKSGALRPSRDADGDNLHGDRA